jgi:hypothetical protein
LSVKTIESHRENIKHKLRLSSGAQVRDRAAKWVAAATGVCMSGKLPVHIFSERKPPHPADSEELHRRRQQQRPGRARHDPSLQIPGPAGAVSVIPEV